MQPFLYLFQFVSGTVSRVLSRVTICLGLPSPAASSDLPEAGRAPSLPCGLASDGVYMCRPCHPGRGSLLHCLSTLTGQKAGGLFLLHCPWSHLRRSLSGILPCEARTFLSKSAAATYPTYAAYSNTFIRICKMESGLSPCDKVSPNGSPLSLFPNMPAACRFVIRYLPMGPTYHFFPTCLRPVAL